MTSANPDASLQPPAPQSIQDSRALLCLQGVRVLSLALNLPGPAALMRCRDMGACCVKLEPLPPASAGAAASGDPMGAYSPPAYAALHAGIRRVAADLKTDAGQQVLHQELAQADVVITSFRPSALKKLGLDWVTLHRRYPALSQVAIVGAPDARAEEPGHDVTYLAEHDLITGLDLPATLYADMGGSLMASEAVLKATLHNMAARMREGGTAPAEGGIYLEVALSSAAAYLALPRAWGLTTAGAAVGGGHAGYRIYPCLDGRVAVAALEPHFAARLCAAAGFETTSSEAMFGSAAHAAIASFFKPLSRAQVEELARLHDIPLHTLSTL